MTAETVAPEGAARKALGEMLSALRTPSSGFGVPVPGPMLVVVAVVAVGQELACPGSSSAPLSWTRTHATLSKRGLPSRSVVEDVRPNGRLIALMGTLSRALED